MTKDLVPGQTVVLPAPRPGRPRASPRVTLPLQTQRELELPWVRSRRGLAGVRVKRVNIGNVVAVGDVKQVHDAFEFEVLAQGESAGHAEVVEEGPGAASCITS